MNSEITNKIYTIVDKENISLDSPMSSHTSFRIGGNADVYIDISKKELAPILKLCSDTNTPVTIIGNGSNVLVADKGIRGVTICIGKRMADIRVEDNTIEVGAGALLSRTANVALEHNLSGMEFASGIPGSIGGAVLMNAGAYDGEIKDILVSARVLTNEGVVREYSNRELELSYRHSKLMETGGVILSAILRLKTGDYDSIKAKMGELNKRRIDKQPLNLPSAGSTFKRPKGYYAGRLIEASNLRGYRVGGAMISDKHCGFVVNVDNATAEDVKKLMQDVSDKVYEDSKVRLEPEVRFIGEFD